MEGIGCFTYFSPSIIFHGYGSKFEKMTIIREIQLFWLEEPDEKIIGLYG